MPDLGPAVASTGSGDVSRRVLLGAAGACLLGIGGVAGWLARSSRDGDSPTGTTPTSSLYFFHGIHQAGIVTPAQDRLHFATFDVTADSRAELVALLQDWTVAAARMTSALGAGERGPASGPPDQAPDDTGETLGLPASRLTVTFGFGPTLFVRDGKDRFGLADRQPDALRRLPAFAGDRLDPASCDGDLCVQACADDPQVAVHAVRNLARIASGRARVRWSQHGFGRTSSTSTTQTTARNLFGFKDGTANLKVEDPQLVDEHVWVHSAGDPRTAWLEGGTYLVVRRINMDIETWDQEPLEEQESVVGRTKGEGGPLSGGGEYAAPDFTRLSDQGKPLIPVDAHIRLAHPDLNRGAAMLRRGYNFVHGYDEHGHMDAGLFFMAYIRDPRTHYIPLQDRLARHDGLREYLRHTGSAIFVVPPGAQLGHFIGESLVG